MRPVRLPENLAALIFAKMNAPFTGRLPAWHSWNGARD